MYSARVPAKTRRFLQKIFGQIFHELSNHFGKLIERSSIVNLAAHKAIRDKRALEKGISSNFSYFKFQQSEFFLTIDFALVLHRIWPQFKIKLNRSFVEANAQLKQNFKHVISRDLIFFQSFVISTPRVKNVLRKFRERALSF
jgi:hypothetical protein